MVVRVGVCWENEISEVSRTGRICESAFRLAGNLYFQRSRAGYRELTRFLHFDFRTNGRQ